MRKPAILAGPGDAGGGGERFQQSGEKRGRALRDDDGPVDRRRRRSRRCGPPARRPRIRTLAPEIGDMILYKQLSQSVCEVQQSAGFMLLPLVHRYEACKIGFVLVALPFVKLFF